MQTLVELQPTDSSVSGFRENTSPQMAKQTSLYVRCRNRQQVPQFARLPQATQRRDDRVEEIQENQRTDGSKCSRRLRALSWTQPSRVPPLPTFQTGHDRLKPVLLSGRMLVLSVKPLTEESVG